MKKTLMKANLSELLTSSGEGINLTQKQLHRIDRIITPLIEQGHSPYMILTNHPELNEFSFLFPVILTDRGGEFGEPDRLEKDRDGNPRTSIFYCDPMRSNQKGGIENVHTMLRMIIPKGTVLEGYTQWDIRRAVDHINNAPGKNLGGQTPYEMALKAFGQNILEKLQLRYVAPDKVTLTPKLLK